MSVPALRFKDDDGQDFPEWEEANIKSLFTIKAGGDIDSSSVSAVKNEVYRYPIFSNSEKNLGLFGYADNFKIENESITVTGRGSLGIAIPRYEPYYPIVRLLSLIPKYEFNVYFGAMVINTLDVFVESTGVPQLTAPQMSEYVIFYPSIDEQTKIANFLTVVDEKINQITQKYDLLTQYKKGVMQQIFSQELRFKDDDGQDFSEWEETNLREIAQIIGGGTPDTSVAEYWQGNVQWFTPTEIKTKYATNSLRAITETGLKNSSAKVLPVGTLLFSSRATVGEVSIALNECTTNQGFQSMIVSDKNNNEFIYYWILNNKKVFLEKASGSTFLEISKKEIEKLLVHHPCIKEQTKIANFFSAIDDKITATQTQLNAIKQYKQGLLQQMFV